MIDLKLLEHLETYLTESRKGKFTKVLSQRTKHFTVATEDVYQLHNTSAVMRTCDVFGIQELSIEVILTFFNKNKRVADICVAKHKNTTQCTKY